MTTSWLCFASEEDGRDLPVVSARYQGYDVICLRRVQQAAGGVHDCVAIFLSRRDVAHWFLLRSSGGVIVQFRGVADRSGKMASCREARRYFRQAARV